ncbi:MAG: hypothetical protein PVI86_02565 [Phycisphaerae bacterium]|jgi:hypothetical protein
MRVSAGFLVAGAFIGVAAGTALGADSDGDGVDDSIDVCCNTPEGIAVDSGGRPLGDLDLDCDNDLVDLAQYLMGFTGSLVGPVECPECVNDRDCDDDNDCTDDFCEESSTADYFYCDHPPVADGTLCIVDESLGVCDGGVCVGDPAPQTLVVPMVCSNSATGDILTLGYELTVDPLDPIEAGFAFDAMCTGEAVFPRSLANMLLSVIPGLTDISLNGLNATVVVRKGATGDPLLLGVADPPGPLPAVLTLPVVDDQQRCSTAGLNAPCVLEDVVIPLGQGVETFMAGAGGGEVLFGWDESELPPVAVVAHDPPGPNGMRVVASVLVVGLECYMGRMNGNGTPHDETDDYAERLPDAALMSFPIEP